MQPAKNLIKNIQEQIQIRMEDKNLDIRNLERKAGLKIGAVRNILNNTSKNPGIEAITSIAKLLNCSIDELVGREVSSYITKKEETKKEKIISAWNSTLYVNCLKEVENYLQSKNLQPQPEQILFFIKEAYIYSMELNDGKPDLKFIKWTIDSHC